MTRAKELALAAYPEKDATNKKGTGHYDPNYQRRKAFQQGYVQAEKDIIKRAVAWLKEHANEYIVDLTPTYPDAPVNIIVGDMCWEDLKKAMEEEE